MEVNKLINDWMESRACFLFNKYLKDLGFNTKLNNLESNDIDLLVSNEKKSYKVDVQYSFNFQKYGDIRIDLISAAIRKEEFKNKEIKELNALINESENPKDTINKIFSVKKKGKYFQSEDIMGVFYIIYNSEKPKDFNVEMLKTKKIDSMIFIPKHVILEEIKINNKKNVYKINDKKKNEINENHDSAFLCINLNYLSKTYSIPFFKNRAELMDKFPAIFEKYFKNMEKNQKVLISK